MTRVFNTRLVFRTMGALLLIESICMGLATAISWWYHEADFGPFLVSTVLTCIAGGIGLAIGHSATKRVGEREGYVIVASVWLIFSLFGMLPYYLSGAIPTITDAWFETMSGFTTTGATILTDVEVQTHGVLFWRALTQWLGGMGIIVLSIAILPMFGLGGMQLYAAEMNGLSYEKISPRIADTAKHLWITYIILTVSAAALLYVEGMPIFDSVCHSFSTIATGGFSTKNMSIAYYDNRWIEYTISVFMILSGVNFAMLIFLFRGKGRRLLQDEETKWYLTAVGICALILSAGLFIHYGLIQHNGSFDSWQQGLLSLERAIRKGLFMAASAMTSTGYAASDYMTWPNLLWVIVFFMMFTGASSGSTSGGIKWVRIMVFLKSGVTEFKRRIHPNAIVPVKINGRPVSQQTTNNVMAFMVFYLLMIVATVITFCACGVSFEEAIGTAVSSIGNIGISIGQYGPSGSYAHFPTIGKWVMTVVMLIGRLEIFTILLLFTRVLWRK